MCCALLRKSLNISSTLLYFSLSVDEKVNTVFMILEHFSGQAKAEIVPFYIVSLCIDDFLTRSGGGLTRLIPVKLREDVVHNNMLNMPSCTVERER